MIIHDRYSATGTPYPDPATACNRCEAMGCYPLYDARAVAGVALRRTLVTPAEKLTGEDKTLWEAAHADAGDHVCDGWHVVKCPDCQGTRKKEPS